ncbi:MAG: Uma2 family endonuclease [Hymenobacter sp.]|nr:MAG: Uma2 family endonuclease [Hymenobacter sp.]
MKKPSGLMEALEITLSDYELERGKPMPSFNHGFVQANLIGELRSRLRKTHTITSETNLKLSDKKTVPDLTVFAKRTPDMQHDTLWVQDAPLTTIEILSPKQDLDTLLAKAELFLAAGVKSCWIVIPALGTIAVFTGPTTYRSFANGSAVVDEVLGVEIPLADIFS